MAQRERTEQVRSAARGAAATAASQPWVRPLARLGFIAIGVVYGLIGALALRLALGFGGETTDQQGALRQVLEAPFGRLLLGLIALGLFGYLIWRIIEATLDVEGKGDDAKGLITRTGYFISGLLAGYLAFEAARMALGGGGGGGGGDGAQDWTARLMSQPFGPLLVGLVGAIVIGVGGYQIYRAVKEKYREKLAWGRMSASEHTLADRAGKIGLIAHGIVLAMIGWFFIQAAISFNPEEAGGIGQALSELAAQPYGPWMLGAVALGLIAFGIYRFFEGRYHRVLAS